MTEATLTFVIDALATLPEDPASVTEADFERLASIQQGAARLTGRIAVDASELALELFAGSVGAGDAVARTADIGRRHRLAVEADRLLTSYVTAAIEARGFSAADLIRAAPTPHNAQEGIK